MAGLRSNQHTQRKQPASPALAAALTWFVPGAGHLLLGRYGFALVAFVVVEGLYWLGVRLTDGMLFEYLQPDLRTPMAPLLSPETGNLGALLWHRREFPYIPAALARPWPSTQDLGVLLTAISGILNLCLVVRAHTDASDAAGARKGAAQAVRRVPSRSTAVLLAWLVPGLGHWYAGRKLRALLVFVLLVGLFLLGSALAEGSNLDRERHFFYWGGQAFLGLPAFAAELLWGHGRVDGEIRYVDAGLVFGCVAGLLNVLMMIDAYGAAEHEASSPARAAPETGPEAKEARA